MILSAHRIVVNNVNIKKIDFQCILINNCTYSDFGIHISASLECYDSIIGYNSMYNYSICMAAHAWDQTGIISD